MQDLRHVVAFAQPDEVRIDFQPFRLAPHEMVVVAPRLSPHNRQTRPRLCGQDLRHRADQIQQSLAADDIPYDTQERRVLVDSQFPPNTGPGPPRHARQAVLVDEVVDGHDPPQRHEVQSPVESSRCLTDGDHQVVEPPMELEMAAVRRGHAGNAARVAQQDTEEVGPTHMRVDHVDLPGPRQCGHAP